MKYYFLLFLYFTKKLILQKKTNVFKLYLVKDIDNFLSMFQQNYLHIKSIHLKRKFPKILEFCG